MQTRILSRTEAAARLGVSVRLLDEMFRRGTGPKRVALSDRRVGYRDTSIDEFVDTKESTHHQAA